MEDCRESKIDFDRYIVLENGDIISKHIKKPISTKTYKGNDYVYNTFTLKDGGQEPFSRHRVIWYYFNGNIPDGLDIDHIDTNKKNNALSNLRCVSRGANMANTNTRQKMESIWNDPIRNEKIRQCNTGKVVSEEQKRKQSQAMKGKKKGIKRPEHSALMKKAKRDELGRFVK